jgi:dTDP-4-dehydrorhamnose 3,5-epimerase
MEFIKTRLEGAYLIIPRVFKDERGLFLETYSRKEFEQAGIVTEFVQDNHSMSGKKGVLRGLHFQLPPASQAKLVRVTKGSVYDVIVDLRKNSETFGRWQGFELSSKNFNMLFIPKGFAHGFCTLEENTEFQYKCDDFYVPESDSGLLWNDSDLKIDWPIKNPILSEKDKKQQTFKNFSENNLF